MRPIIELQNVWKIYDMEKVHFPALKGISLRINPADFIAIMGPSGSGKSTLVNLLGCLDIPTKGRIFLDGKDISRLSESTLAQIRGRKIGFVFQQFNLIPVLTALQNVALPMIFQGVPEGKRTERAKQLLKAVGLSGRETHRPTELSGGEQQRVAIARALVNDPEIILADEPTGNLDSNTGKQVMDMLRELHDKHEKTLIVVTHDPYIAKYAEHLLNLKDGQLVRDHGTATKYLRGQR